MSTNGRGRAGRPAGWRAGRRGPGRRGRLSGLIDTVPPPAAAPGRTGLRRLNTGSFSPGANRNRRHVDPGTHHGREGDPPRGFALQTHQSGGAASADTRGFRYRTSPATALLPRQTGTEAAGGGLTAPQQRGEGRGGRLSGCGPPSSPLPPAVPPPAEEGCFNVFFFFPLIA